MLNLAQRQKRLLSFEAVLKNFDLPMPIKTKLAKLVSNYRLILFKAAELADPATISELQNLERQLETTAEYARLNNVLTK